jgi:hypothetical protein
MNETPLMRNVTVLLAGAVVLAATAAATKGLRHRRILKAKLPAAIMRRPLGRKPWP